MKKLKLIRFVRSVLLVSLGYWGATAAAQVRREAELHCGVREDASWMMAHAGLRTASTTPAPVLNDNVLRTYRLALPIDYSFLTRHFSGNVERAKEFWTQAEHWLNVIYQRDFGIRFILIKDDALIRKTSEEEIFSSGTTSYTVVGRGTRELNKLIDRTSYDVALWLVDFADNRGLASSRAAYENDKAACASSVTAIGTIAHELGHLFGASHTGMEDALWSIKTEPRVGTSIMSYGFYNTPDAELFFSLASIQQVQEILLQCGYFVSDERTTYVPSSTIRYDNYGIGTARTEMRRRAFDGSTLPTEYRIPAGTPFRIEVPAYDDAKDYLYAVHQNDRENGQAVARGWSESPRIYIGNPMYEPGVNYGTAWDPWPQIGLPVGTYNFILGAVEKKSTDATEPYKRSFDSHQFRVIVEEAGDPFTLTMKTKIGSRYLRVGESITLRWTRPAFVAQYETVRIWMSDDYGKTFKHLITPDGTPNDGEHTFTAPDIYVGYSQRLDGSSLHAQGKGVFLVEIVGHIAVATTDYKPIAGMTGGGFMIERGKKDVAPSAETLYRPRTDLTPEPKAYAVSIEPSLGGRVRITHELPSAIPDGTQVTVTVIPDDNYTLKTLLAGEEDITQSLSFAVRGDTRLRAVFQSTTSLHDVAATQTKVYPTRVKSLLHVQGYELLSTIELYDFSGVRLGVWDGRPEVDMSHLPGGRYLVVLRQSDGTAKSYTIHKD